MWLGLTTFWLEIPLSWEDIRKNCDKFLHRVVPCQPMPSWWRKWWRVSQQAVHGHQDALLCAAARKPKENVELWTGYTQQWGTINAAPGKELLSFCWIWVHMPLSRHLKWVELSKEDRVKSGCDVKLLLSVWLETGLSCRSCFHCLSIWIVRRFCFVPGSNPMGWKRGLYCI